ncbi:MAG: CPBP family intramembrane glutamic endopeptidase [Verrucomicrobiota bacterium]
MVDRTPSAEDAESASLNSDACCGASPWVSWLVILASLVGIILLARLGPEAEADVSESVSEEAVTPANPADQANFVVLQIQAKTLIASDRFDPDSSAASLKTLLAQSGTAESRAALILLIDFLEKNGAFDELDLTGTTGKAEWSGLFEKARAEGLSEEERDELAVHLGWFANLPMAEDGEPTPYLDEIKRESYFTAGVTIALTLVLFLAVLVGILLLVYYFIFMPMSGRPRDRFSREQLPRAILLECFAVYLGVAALSEWIGYLFYPPIGMAGFILAIFLPIFWPWIRRSNFRLTRRSAGWHLGAGFWKEVGAGVIGYVAMLPIAAVGVAIMLIVILLAGVMSASGAPSEGGATAGGMPQPNAHPIVVWISEGGWLLRLLCFFLAAVVAPVSEELLFRGALHRWLRGRLGFFVSAVIGGLIFAALHPQGLLAIPALGGIAVGLALIREWRDSLIAPMVAHAINNGVLVLLLCLLL